MRTLKLGLRGTVQGVGFRPWIYRLARQHNLTGFVQNTSSGATIAVEGADAQMQGFVKALETPPAPCVINHVSLQDMPSGGYQDFSILESRDDGGHEALVLPDIATCPECLKDIFDPGNRRYLYPLTNCSHCGPRYSILEALPYDRGNTSMKTFQMCTACQAEYDDPFNRRFHAQPNACPKCGPKLALLNREGRPEADGEDVLTAAARLIKSGRIVAVKGLGGFHLMVDALNDQAVRTLRERKARPFKPLAVMMPSLQHAVFYAEIGLKEAQLLQSAAAPIVLLKKLEGFSSVAGSVAPGNPYLGMMLPSMPLHHILMRMVDGPVVATSGNLSEEPICVDNQEALERLGGIADHFLVHDRPIVRQVDDSIVQVVCGEPSLLRRSKGYAPLPLGSFPAAGILAVGAQQKNAVALGLNEGGILGQHIGDLDNAVSMQAFERSIDSLASIYDAPRTVAVCDQHPDYASSRYAHALSLPVIEVQHHQAHVAACMAEHGLDGDVMGVCWDGTGYGSDKTIWGGEIFVTHRCGRPRNRHCQGQNDGLVSFERIAHLTLFGLPGGEAAVKEPRRAALGLLYELCEGRWHEFEDLPCMGAFRPVELAVAGQMLKKRVHTPMTSSMGRLFDGVASILGLCHFNTFEGQAAMALEFQADDSVILPAYSTFVEGETVDWRPMLLEMIENFRQGKDVAYISSRFHHTLAAMIVAQARACGIERVVLTGGCFQNKLLTETAVSRLREAGYTPYWHHQVPANDGGIALGQMYIAANRYTTATLPGSVAVNGAKYVSGHTRKN